MVSVLIPAHNAGATVVTSVRSMLRQTWRRLEIIVIDDGSTDQTPELLASLANSDRRVQILRQPNQGIAAALNAGLMRCSGEYIARMDADDISLPWRIARQVRFMEQNPTVVASGTNVIPFRTRPLRTGVPSRLPTDDMGIRTRLLFNPPILHPTAIIRSSVICDGDFYDRSMPQAQDFELWSRLSREHRLGNISDICLLYRKAAGAISERLRGEQQARADAIRVANLIERCGSAFGERHMVSHIEMMARRFEAPTPAEHMPGYVRDLLDQPGLSRAVIERTWLSYCIDYSRAGGDGAALLAASGVRADLVDHSMLLIAKRLPSRRTIS